MGAIAKQRRHPRFILASSMAICGEGAYRCKTCEKHRNGRRNSQDLSNRHWEPRCPECGEDLEPRAVTEDQSFRPSSIYAISKLSQELLCMNLGRNFLIPVVALRYHNIYGPRMPRDTPYAGVASIFKSRLLACAAPIVYEDGKQLRDFIHVDDIVQANILAAEADEKAVAYEAFNVGTGRPHQIGDFARELTKWLAPDIKPEFPGLFRPGDVRHIFANISKIESLGFRPHVSFEEGVSQFAREPTRESPKAVAS
jgi:dTDP-L-rhamnose 4-epimerase